MTNDSDAQTPSESGKAPDPTPDPTPDPAPQKQPKKRGLGRGLNALFGDDEAEFGYADDDVTHSVTVVDAGAAQNTGQNAGLGSTALTVTSANALTVREPTVPGFQHWSERNFELETGPYSNEAYVTDDARAQNADYASPAGGRRLLSVAQLSPGMYQPRQNFDEVALEELAQSIREHGLIQPIVVRPIPGQPDDYEIVAGERRWRAAQRARLHEVPVIIRALDDRATMELALIENLQRQDLSPLEEAEALQRLINECDYTQEKAGLRVGKSRSYVANILRLLDLDLFVRKFLMEGKITAGHARAMLPLSAELQHECVKKIIALNLNVRQTERLVGDSMGRVPPMPRNVGKLEAGSSFTKDGKVRGGAMLPHYQGDLPERYRPDQGMGSRMGEHGRSRSNPREGNDFYEGSGAGEFGDDTYDHAAHEGYEGYESYDDADYADRATGTHSIASSKDVSTLALEREVSNLLGTNVTIDMNSQQSGIIKINYATLDQLDDVLHRLSHNPGRLAIKG